MPNMASTASSGGHPQTNGNSCPRINDCADENGGPPSGKKHKGQNGWQPSRRQRLGMEEATATNNRLARIASPPCPAGYPEGVCATTMKDVPRHRETFKQLVTLISGRRAATDTLGEPRELPASGKAMGYNGDSRERLASGKAKVRQNDGLQEQLWKKN